MRAHNRLESRYSNSSGGSYDEDKSEYILVPHPIKNVVVMVWWVWNTQTELEGKMVTGMVSLIMHEQCRVSWGS